MSVIVKKGKITKSEEINIAINNMTFSSLNDDDISI